MKLEWEHVDDNQGGDYLYRAKVPGGWLVKLEASRDRYFADGQFRGTEWETVGMSFIQDPDGTWLPKRSLNPHGC